MEWLTRFGSAIEYIENNLDKDMSIETAARIACCSSSYFQRMFTYVAGISLGEYIRRRRMTQAAFELQRTDEKVLDIALKYGYSSPTSFNRAFQKVHGITPVLAKHAGSILNLYSPIKFSVSISGGSALSYHIEHKQSIRIVGMRCALEEDIQANLNRVPTFWQEVLQGDDFSKISHLSNQEPDGILGVSSYIHPQNMHYYIAVASDAPVPKGMVELVIPEATWVVFDVDGYFKEDAQLIFRRFLNEFLPFSGYEYAHLPDVEIYPISKDTPHKGHFAVWIAIRKKGDM